MVFEDKVYIAEAVFPARIFLVKEVLFKQICTHQY